MGREQLVEHGEQRVEDAEVDGEGQEEHHEVPVAEHLRRLLQHRAPREERLVMAVASTVFDVELLSLGGLAAEK